LDDLTYTQTTWLLLRCVLTVGANNHTTPSQQKISEDSVTAKYPLLNVGVRRISTTDRSRHYVTLHPATTAKWSRDTSVDRPRAVTSSWRTTENM